MSEKNYSNEKKGLNPIIILLGILFLATLLTYIVDSGVYERDGNMVVANSYNIIDKDKSLSNLFNYQDADLVKAEPVSIIGTFMAIPSGLEQGSGLIFMVLIIGGMFGILTKAGTIDAGLERLLSLVQGNIYVLVILLMIVFSAGSTFLGLASEYLLIIPLMVGMANRLGLPNIIGFAIVCVAVKAGYLSSVTNPLPLTIAQPLLGLQIFSGASVRFFFYLAFLAVGIGFVLFMIKRQGFKNEQVHFHSEKLSTRHVIILLTLTSGIALLVYASTQWHWKHHALSAYYIALSMVLAAISGLSANQAAQAFVDGMKKVLLASILIGVATAVAVVLKQGMVLDSIVHFLMSFIGEGNAYFAATGMFVSQLMLDFLIPSTSGQAAVSMPILGPIGNLAGVSEQTTIVAFLFGNGITNILTPTSGTLLAYLATARVGWGEWAKFIFPLWLIYIVLAIVLLQVSVFINF
ncbi:YfcC family protein [Pseudoalteromonas sp. NZS127]|uniref:YfcC family protein n=1 Tax=Pseudoalteromonas TaxID=53246 RepID=UPI0018CE0774|nr:AbgT family transporter [Pseudoalteromonas sp. NZS127]MBH0073631.1 YfcC family protein [Pseudoalteromonas sp. NZS127]|tara:strand:+ start:13552 stop:14943 length:1392 start_codon:yes stop_codon:yes gene_type:complete